MWRGRLSAPFSLTSYTKPQIHPETHAFLTNGFKTYGARVWHEHFKVAVKAAGQEEKLPMLELLLLDDGSATYKTFMKNVGLLEITCAVFKPNVHFGFTPSVHYLIEHPDEASRSAHPQGT